MEVISSFYLFLEILGTVAFAISGTVVGINHKLDIFGILVMSVITAVGGGIFRDLLLGATPPTALKSPFFIVISIIASIVAMLVALIIKSRREALSIFKAARFYNNLLLVSDAIGLGIFTVLGIDAGNSTWLFTKYLLHCILRSIDRCRWWNDTRCDCKSSSDDF